MTRIIVDKEMALKAVYFLFKDDIMALYRTQPLLYQEIPDKVEIIFDFEKDCSKCGLYQSHFTETKMDMEITVSQPATMIWIKEDGCKK